MGTHYPYLKKMNKNNMVVLPMHWMLDDWVHFGWNMYPSFPCQANLQSQETVCEIWKGEFDVMYGLDEGCAYTLYMHPQLIGRASRIAMLKRFIRHMKQFPGVWITNPGELASRPRRFCSGDFRRIIAIGVGSIFENGSIGDW
jgi:peptidoglycan-N-acetylglucosamine deacetylase